MALFPQQRITAVTGAIALNHQLMRKVHDEASVGVELADRMQAAYERALTIDPVEGWSAHSGHEPHICHDIGAVGDLDAAAGIGRVDGPHAVRNHIERAAVHTAIEQDLHVCLRRVHPVIVRPSFALLGSADEGEVFDPRHIVGV